MASDYEELKGKLREIALAERDTERVYLRDGSGSSCKEFRRKVSLQVLPYELSADPKAAALVREMTEMYPDDEALWTWLFAFAEDGEGG